MKDLKMSIKMLHVVAVYRTLCPAFENSYPSQAHTSCGARAPCCWPWAALWQGPLAARLPALDVVMSPPPPTPIPSLVWQVHFNSCQKNIVNTNHG